MPKKKPRWSSLDHAKRAVESIKDSGQQVSLATIAQYRNDAPETRKK